VAEVDWAGVAGGIAEELFAKKPWQNGDPRVFEASARLQAPLSEYAHEV
jgi:hypothetical protein